MRVTLPSMALPRFVMFLPLNHGAHLCVLCSTQCSPSMSMGTTDAGTWSREGRSRNQRRRQSWGSKLQASGCMLWLLPLPLVQPQAVVKKGAPPEGGKKEKPAGKAKGVAKGKAVVANRECWTGRSAPCVATSSGRSTCPSSCTWGKSPATGEEVSSYEA